MPAGFAKVETEAQIDELAALAEEIWMEYWPPLIGEGQTRHMVEKFQSGPAIRDQLANQDYEYYFILGEDGRACGFTGIKPDGEGKLFLSKLYLRKEERGKHYASDAIAFLEGLCRERNLSAIWLTVNRGNTHTIDVYKAKGFQVIRTQVTPIGEGYVMDDYIMELQVTE